VSTAGDKPFDQNGRTYRLEVVENSEGKLLCRLLLVFYWRPQILVTNYSWTS
jgi:hypothetical protein